MNWQLVINHIPIGRDKPVSKDTLRALTGFSEREIRRAVEEARRNGVMIVSSARRKGYYIADDPEDWDGFLKELKGRIKTTIETYNKCAKSTMVINDGEIQQR